MSSLLLVHVRGEDRKGLLTTMTGLLATHKAEVLDMAQSLIHNSLNMSLVIRFPEEDVPGDAIKDLVFQTHELGLTIKFKPLGEEEYHQWVEEHSENRYVITLLSRHLKAEQISKVTSTLLGEGLNIETIRRLTHPRRVDGKDAHERTCLEMGVRGRPQDTELLKKRFLELSSQHGVDVAIQLDDIFRRNRRLVVFDMDSTLLRIEVIDELARKMGVVDQVSTITEAAMNGEIDFDESFRRRVRLLKGMKREVIDHLIANMPLNEGAERLIRSLKSVGYKVAILSGGFKYFVEALQESLGVDYGYANELEFDGDVATGEVLGEIINGEKKREYMKKIAEQEGIDLKQVIAVGDGANDLPMLSEAGLGVAFRAKPLVKASADQHLSEMGLDGLLYLLGFNDSELRMT
jgi:phosphoserine phosphatase